MTKTALITGATAGIGEAIAEKFAEHNLKLIITGRRTDRLKALSDRLKTQYNTDVLTLTFDIRDHKAVKKAIDTLAGEWKKIDILVNNAGLAAGLDFIQDGLLEDWDLMIDTNIKGLLYITKEIVPLMIANKSGHIINLGSIAGKEVYPKGNVYCATKFAVDALTRGMRVDLLEQGIRVSQASPGMVETEFSLVRFKGDEQRARNVYSQYQPLSADDVAEVVWFIATRPPHVNILDVVMTPANQANVFISRKA